MSGMVTLLKQLPYFGAVDAADLATLALSVHRREHERGTVIVAQGEEWAGLFFVILGQVKLVRLGENGREQVLRIVNPGGTFNDEPMFDDGGATATAVSLGPSVTGLVPAARVARLLDHHPRIARAAARLFAERLRHMAGLVEDLTLRDVGARVARLLLSCGCGARAAAEGGGDACRHLTQEQLAAMTGTVREVVQRTLKAFERAGAIELSRARIRILDPALLADWAGAANLRAHKDGSGGGAETCVDCCTGRADLEVNA